MDRVPEELWMEVYNIVQEAVTKAIPKKKKCKKAKWLSKEALQIAKERGETYKAESETADLQQPKQNENQTVLATAIHNPDRDAGPLEVTAAGS